MLIDRFLPRYDVHERHTIEDAVPGDRAYHTLHEVDLADSTLVRVLLALRGLPRRRRLDLESLTDLGFVLLGE